MTEMTLEERVELLTEMERVSRVTLHSILTVDEITDLIAAAKERGRSVRGIIHDAVMDDLVR